MAVMTMSGLVPNIQSMTDAQLQTVWNTAGSVPIVGEQMRAEVSAERQRRASLPKHAPPPPPKGVLSNMLLSHVRIGLMLEMQVEQAIKDAQDKIAKAKPKPVAPSSMKMPIMIGGGAVALGLGLFLLKRFI
jgi:hypothetical protein